MLDPEAITSLVEGAGAFLGNALRQGDDATVAHMRGIFIAGHVMAKETGATPEKANMLAAQRDWHALVQICRGGQ